MVEHFSYEKLLPGPGSFEPSLLMWPVGGKNFPLDGSPGNQMKKCRLRRPPGFRLAPDQSIPDWWASTVYLCAMCKLHMFLSAEYFWSSERSPSRGIDLKENPSQLQLPKASPTRNRQISWFHGRNPRILTKKNTHWPRHTFCVKSSKKASMTRSTRISVISSPKCLSIDPSHEILPQWLLLGVALD